MEVAKFQRILIQIKSANGEIGLKRNLKPARYYADLQAKVETYHPGFVCILTVPDTQEIVGSQFELLCAYRDSPKGILTLNLSLQKREIPPLKRPYDESDEDVEHDGLFRRTGVWLPGEVELFKEGVVQYGWGEWCKIAEYIGTRDRTQVRKFSLNEKAKKVLDQINVSLNAPRLLFPRFPTWPKG